MHLRCDGAQVGIIVVNWNGARDTIACLDSLRLLDHPQYRPYVIDNGSTDGSADMIAAAHPESWTIRTDRNLGYAGAFNLGRERALGDGCDYLWLLNNDTVVESPALRALIAAARQQGPAILSPTILNAAGTIWSTGGTLDWKLKSHHRDEGAKAGICRQAGVIPWASGCSLFCSAATARLAGPMDERYFLYLEDVDWCLKAGRAGIPTVFVPEARIQHTVSSSVGRLGDSFVGYYAWRNYYLLVRENGSWWQRLCVYADLASRFMKIAVRSSLFPACRQDPVYQARTRGLVDFVSGSLGEGAPHATARGAPVTEVALS